MTSIKRLTTQLFSVIDVLPVTRKKVAESAGISPQTLKNLADGRTNISLSNFLAVANELGYDLSLVPLDEVEVANKLNTNGLLDAALLTYGRDNPEHLLELIHRLTDSQNPPRKRAVESLAQGEGATR